MSERSLDEYTDDELRYVAQYASEHAHDSSLSSGEYRTAEESGLVVHPVPDDERERLYGVDDRISALERHDIPFPQMRTVSIPGQDRDMLVREDEDYGFREAFESGSEHDFLRGTVTLVDRALDGGLFLEPDVGNFGVFGDDLLFTGVHDPSSLSTLEALEREPYHLSRDDIYRRMAQSAAATVGVSVEPMKFYIENVSAADDRERMESIEYSGGERKEREYDRRIR